MKPLIERRLLQVTFIFGALVPLLGGIWGAQGGLDGGGIAADSQVRYLSGLLLALGLAFWACVPSIEHRGPTIRLLGAMVFVGGVARLWDALDSGFPATVSLPLVMELCVTPAVVLWRERVEQRVRGSRSHS